MNLATRVIIAIVAAVFINLLIQPLLLTVLPPFGMIAVILLYVADLFYIFGYNPLA